MTTVGKSNISSSRVNRDFRNVVNAGLVSTTMYFFSDEIATLLENREISVSVKHHIGFLMGLVACK